MMTPERTTQITDEISLIRGIAMKLASYGRRHNDEVTPIGALFEWFADRMQDAFARGIDWAYEPGLLDVKVYETRYLGEKIARVFGRFMGTFRSRAEHHDHVAMFIKSAQWDRSEQEGLALVAFHEGIELGRKIERGEATLATIAEAAERVIAERKP